MTRLALIGLMFLAAAACSANGHPAVAGDGSADGDAATVDAEDGAAPDAEIVNATCQQIRLCVAAGGGVDACLAHGTPDAQMVFMSLLACETAACPDLQAACVCREACQQPDGYCLDQADACLTTSGATVDAVCDHYCGG